MSKKQEPLSQLVTSDAANAYPGGSREGGEGEGGSLRVKIQGDPLKTQHAQHRPKPRPDESLTLCQEEGDVLETLVRRLIRLNASCLLRITISTLPCHSVEGSASLSCVCVEFIHVIHLHHYEFLDAGTSISLHTAPSGGT